MREEPGKRMTTWMSEAQEAVIGIVMSSPRSAVGKKHRWYYYRIII